jgi:hypothetical protein
MELVLIGELLTLVRWIESLPDDVLDPDTALQPLEWLGHALDELAPQDRALFIDAARRLPGAGHGARRDAIERSLTGLGLVEWSGGLDEGPEHEAPPAPPDLDARVATIAGALRTYIGEDRQPGFEPADGIPLAELAVVEAALAGGGPVGDRVLRQLREAAQVWRRATDDGDYELRISIVDALRFRDWPQQGWESAWIPVTAMPGPRSIDLRIRIPPEGVAALEGRTRDLQPWPQEWEPLAADLATIRDQGPWLSMPTPTDLLLTQEAAEQAIGRWLGQPDALRGRGGYVRAEPPASESDLTGLEERERFQLPAAYRELLLRTNGIVIAGIEILGTRDAQRLDRPGPDRLVFSLPLDEDMALTLAPTGEVVVVEGGSRTSTGRVVAPDLRDWFAAHLSSRATRADGD